MIPPDYIAELRRTTDIVRFIGDHVPLRRAGSSWKALCPFHEDTQPSFSVRPKPPFFRCFGCGVSGDVFKFAMLRNKATFPEAVGLVAKHAGLACPQGPSGGAAVQESEVFDALEAAAQHYTETLWTSAGLAARDYVVRRGFAKPILERAQAGAATSAWDGVTKALRRRFSPKALMAAGLVKSETAADPAARTRCHSEA